MPYVSVLRPSLLFIHVIMFCQSKLEWRAMEEFNQLCFSFQLMSALSGFMLEL